MTVTAEALCRYDTATLYEANGRTGACAPGLDSLLGGVRVAGPARTVLCAPRDNLALHQAVAGCRPGDVLVANGLDHHTGVWGEVLTVAALQAGVAALVIDGAVRDVDAIAALGFPVFARARALTAADKTTPGALDVPIACAGLLVRPGDWVIADDSGVAVLAADRADAALAAAAVRAGAEVELIARIRAGQTTVELLDLPPTTTNGASP